jgi:hypothetical protein
MERCEGCLNENDDSGREVITRRTPLLSRSRIGEWKQVANAGFGAETASHPFYKNFNPLSGGDESSNQGLEALEWTLGDPNFLSGLHRLSNLQKVIWTCAASDFVY